MNRTQKKMIVIVGLAILAMIALFLGWKLLMALGMLGFPTTTYTRTAAPHGIIWVLLIPIIATATLFLGLTRTKK
ncbi:hypothetical protein IV487_02465 [Enterococcus saccharolyticus]|uniref:Uncharacterized protein n=1 Tax=Candidatus Enterococcus willemsii TaxID=1857215 RepID=A0ABQ6Z1L0_9ENTE|nr:MULTISPECIES: hypothetical protein [Enterococcus]KAF1304594.1 hypothetical protein BAU17_10355 [Enterococcus sp. CU12B]MCD5001329.1 hypothetical protein [Enterococcus saccharolyticus]